MIRPRILPNLLQNREFGSGEFGGQIIRSRSNSAHSLNYSLQQELILLGNSLQPECGLRQCSVKYVPWREGACRTAAGVLAQGFPATPDGAFSMIL
jgi:hypothetical protein